MPCPHSQRLTPESCSLCAGIQPRVVTRDPATGALLVDGVPLERAFDPGESERLAAYRKRGARASGRAKRKRP